MTKKILVVDNHPLIIRLMTNFLEKEGHDVVAAEDGLSALEILKTFTPDVIFIDLVMPNIDGEKLCRIIRGNPALDRTYLVILSAIAAEKKIDFAAFGADACIAKGPFKQVAGHISELFARLDENKESAFPFILGLEGVHQREITKELLSSRRHLEAIINNMTEGVLEITPTGRIVFINSTAAFLLGSQEEKLLAADFTSFFHDIHRTRIKKLLQKTKEVARAVTEEAPLLLRGRQITLQLLPIEDDGSRTVVVIVQDVTERKQNEKELEIYRHHLENLVRERNAELLASNKKLREEMLTRQEVKQHPLQAQEMEALHTLAGGMAHDFKNILQIILGYAELARTAAPGAPEARQGLDKIMEAGARAANLLQQLLAFSRRASRGKKPLLLQEAIGETFSLFAGTTPESIRVLKDIDVTCPPVLADPSQVRQVIFNLVANAQQAMLDNGGTLVLGLQEALIGSEAAARETGLEVGRYAKLTVQDSGPGMEQHILDRIFEPYFTTKAPSEGTGMGLAAVDGIIKSHNGVILAHSTPGQGTTFHVFLPLARPEQ